MRCNTRVSSIVLMLPEAKTVSLVKELIIGVSSSFADPERYCTIEFLKHSLHQ